MHQVRGGALIHEGPCETGHIQIKNLLRKAFRGVTRHKNPMGTETETLDGGDPMDDEIETHVKKPPLSQAARRILGDKSTAHQTVVQTYAWLHGQCNDAVEWMARFKMDWGFDAIEIVETEQS